MRKFLTAKAFFSINRFILLCNFFPRMLNGWYVWKMKINGGTFAQSVLCIVLQSLGTLTIIIKMESGLFIFYGTYAVWYRQYQSC